MVVSTIDDCGNYKVLYMKERLQRTNIHKINVIAVCIFNFKFLFSLVYPIKESIARKKLASMYKMETDGRGSSAWTSDFLTHVYTHICASAQT